MKTEFGHSKLSQVQQSLLHAFTAQSGLTGVGVHVVERSDGDVMVFEVAYPHERFFRLLSEIQDSDDKRAVRLTLKRRTLDDALASSESKLLLKTLSESLTVNRHSFADDFFGRYIRSVFGAEEQVASAGNHVVFGRRGSGKSTLLLYALHVRERDSLPSVWIDMQVYADRNDHAVGADVMLDIMQQVEDIGILLPADVAAVQEQLRAMRANEAAPTRDQMRKLLPPLKRFFGRFNSSSTDLVIFLDDFHVLAPEYQPTLLGLLYGFTRGNRVWLKLSAIETFTRLWEAKSRSGLEVPHDAQLIKLDYNLTMADKARDHVTSILDTHAKYCGLPSVKVLCNSNAVLSRLVWVAAGVPRDALNIFAQAMTKAIAKSQTHVNVTNINVAASEMVDSKLRDLEMDASGSFAAIVALLEDIKNFCIRRQKKNAFLIEIQNDDPTFSLVRQLVDLRLLHVINEAISKKEAGRRYLALILDYGFYIGIRAAKSVDLFNKKTREVKWNELRGLPVFSSQG